MAFEVAGNIIKRSFEALRATLYTEVRPSDNHLARACSRVSAFSPLLYPPPNVEAAASVIHSVCPGTSLIIGMASIVNGTLLTNVQQGGDLFSSSPKL